MTSEADQIKRISTSNTHVIGLLIPHGSVPSRMLRKTTMFLFLVKQLESSPADA